MMDDNCIALFASIVGGISANEALTRARLIKPCSYKKPGYERRAARNADAVRLSREGKTVPQIAEELGMLSNTVYGILRENGVYLRKRKFDDRVK